MTPIIAMDGWTGFAIVLIIALVVQEPWRWLGLYLGRSLSVDSDIFAWVRLVATALVAALVARLVLFPPGDLADVSLVIRLAAVAAGIVAFYATRQNLAAGVLAGAAALIATQLVSV